MVSYVTGSKAELYGLSTDVKPTNVGVGSTFYEVDTKIAHVFDGVIWWIT
jgi:hypothetical protein